MARVDFPSINPTYSFIERINPWTDTLSTESDRKPLVLRSKSPFLFSVILLVTNCLPLHSDVLQSAH